MRGLLQSIVCSSVFVCLPLKSEPLWGEVRSGSAKRSSFKLLTRLQLFSSPREWQASLISGPGQQMPTKTPYLALCGRGALKESNSNLLGRGFHCVPLVHTTASSTPFLFLPVSLPPLPHRIPQAPPFPHCNPTQIHPPRAPVFRLPRLLLYTTTSPQIVRFPVSPCSPCTRMYLPSFNCFQAPRSLCLLYTNPLPSSCCFQVPLCCPGTQIGLPGFGSFQNPLVLSLGSSISPDSAVFRLPSFALYTDTSPRFCCF